MRHPRRGKKKTEEERIKRNRKERNKRGKKKTKEERKNRRRKKKTKEERRKQKRKEGNKRGKKKTEEQRKKNYPNEPAVTPVAKKNNSSTFSNETVNFNDLCCLWPFDGNSPKLIGNVIYLHTTYNVYTTKRMTKEHNCFNVTKLLSGN